MIAFKVLINGKEIVVAGQEDWSVLTTHVNAIRDREGLSNYELRYSTSGLSLENEDLYCQHFRWESHDLQVGDQVSIQVMETAEINNPIKRYRSDNIVQEDPFTEEEARELRYQDYLELRKEFGSNVT